MRVHHHHPRRSPGRALAAAAAVAAAAALLQSAHAGNTWDGGGANASWSTAANWTGNTTPASTDVLVFGIGFGSGSTIALGANRTADSILISTTSGFTLGPNSDSYSLTLTSGIILRQDVTGAEANQTINADLYFPVDGIISVDGSSTLAVSSINQSGGVRSINKNGTGTLDVTSTAFGPNPITGSFYVNAGTVYTGYNSAAFNYVVNGGTLAIDDDTGKTISIAGTGYNSNGAVHILSGSLVYASNPITLTAAATVNVDATAVMQVSGQISDAGHHYTLTKAGGGTMLLTSDESAFTGVYAVTGGTFEVQNTANVGSAATVNVSPGGAIDLYGGATFTRPITASGTGPAGLGAITSEGQYGSDTYAGSITLAGNTSIGAKVVYPGYPMTVTGAISDGASSYSLTKLDTGTVVLPNANTYDGGTAVNDGTLAVGNSASLGTGTVTVGTSSTTATLRIGAGLSLANPMTVNYGTVSVAAGGSASLTGPVTLKNGATFDVPDAASTLTIPSNIGDATGTSVLSKTGPGHLVLSGNNTFFQLTFPATYSTNGDVTLTSSTALGPGGALLQTDGSYNALLLQNNINIPRPLLLNGTTTNPQPLLRSVSGNNTWSGTVSLGNAVGIGVDSGNLSLTNSIGYLGPVPAWASAAFTKTGAGRLILSGSSAVPSLYVAAGIVQFTTSAATPATLAVTCPTGSAVELANSIPSAASPLSIGGTGPLGAGGALRSVSGSNTYAGAITLSTPDTSIGVDPGSTLTINSAIAETTSPTTLTKVGQGTLVLANASNSFSGGVNVAGGTLKVSSSGALGASVAPVTLTNSARLEFTSSVTTFRTFNANNGTLFADPGVSVTYSNATVTGGVLRGTGAHVLSSGTSLLGTSTLNGTTVTQNGAASLSNFSNGGAFTSSAPLTWDAGYNTSSGSLTLNSSASCNNLTNDGLITLNSGAILTNSVTPLVSGGGSRIVVNPSATLTLSSTSLDLYGALLTNNGTINGPVNVGYGATARGYGTYNGPVTVTDGGVFRADAAPAAPATLVVDSLTLAADTSIADINSTLVIDYTGPSPLPTLFASLQSAYHNGLWDEPGVTSSLAADPANGYKTAVAYADNASLNFPNFDGRPLDPTAVLLKYTYYGDANLDGKITADDFALLDRGFSKHLTGWTNGDFNYDGTITSADYLLIDRVYFQQGAPLSPDFLAMRESQFGDAYVQSLIAAIPEPSSLFAACGLALPLIRRRRH